MGFVICKFSTIAGIPKSYKGQEYQDAVFALLKKHKRFSCFEVDDKLGRCLEDLKAQGKIAIITDEERYCYPWVGVEILPTPH